MDRPLSSRPTTPGGPGFYGAVLPVRAVGQLLGLLVLASVVVPVLAGPEGDEAAAAPEIRISSARVEPLVIRPGVLPAWLIVGVPLGFGVQSVVITVPTGSLTQDGVPVDNLTLWDNGINGDPVPNDGLFTTTGIDIDDPEDPLGTVQVHLAIPVEMHYEDGSIDSFQQDLGLAFRYLDASVPDPVLTSHASDVRASPRVVSMLPPSLVGGFPHQTFLPHEVTQRYYDFFPDDRDFLILEYGFSNAGANGQFQTIRNHVSGIFDPAIFGTVLYDDSGFYGSAGVLQGNMTTWRGLATLFGLLNHEFLHRWAHFLGVEMGLYSEGGHGGIIERPSGGFGGGVQLIEEIAPNTFRSIEGVPGDFRYNDYELYLAGLFPLEEVEWPIRAVVNPVKIGDEVCPPELAPCDINIWSGDELREITQADLVATFGARSPDAGSSEKNFRSGLIVLHDRLLTPSELAFYEFGLQEYEKRTNDAFEDFTFYEVTSGRATLSTRLFCEDGDGDDVCDDVDICPTLPNPDQDPEVCDQRIVDVTVDLRGPGGGGSGVVHWRTTHEVSLTGFDVVRLDPAGRRTLLNAAPIPCQHCDTGEGQEYSAIIPKHRGGKNIYIEGLCNDGCLGPWGPAQKLSPANGSPP